MLTAQLAKSMDDEHLLASARAEIDPLTSTALELELLDRFERLLDEQHDNEGVRALSEEYELTADDMRAVIESHPASLKDQAALLSLLNDQDIYEPDQLKALLDTSDKFRVLSEEYELTADDMCAVIESHPASLKDQAALLALLNDQDIHEPDQLKALLDTSDKFRVLANDAGDFFTRLNDLVTANQE